MRRGNGESEEKGVKDLPQDQNTKTPANPLTDSALRVSNTSSMNAKWPRWQPRKEIVNNRCRSSKCGGISRYGEQ